MHEQNAIESMPLYVNVDRINNELAALGIGVDDMLTPEQLFSLRPIPLPRHGRGARDRASARPGSCESRA